MPRRVCSIVYLPRRRCEDFLDVIQHIFDMDFERPFSESPLELMSPDLATAVPRAPPLTEPEFGAEWGLFTATMTRYAGKAAGPDRGALEAVAQC